MEQLESRSGLEDELGLVVFSEDQIQARVAEIGEAISREYAGKDLVLVGVLTGPFMFMADLVRNLTIPAAIDFMAISRFGLPEETQGAVRILKDLDISLDRRHVILVDDFIDTGFTLHYLLRSLRARRPASTAICVLLNRPQRRLIDVPLRFVGFEAPDDFLVGYGLHYNQQYRQLPYLAKLQSLPSTH